MAVQLPGSTWAMIHGRSSSLRERGLYVMPGVIDNGYRGELMTGTWNLTEAPVRLQIGERVSQLLLFHLLAPTPQEVTELSASARGGDGFGSTGN